VYIALQVPELLQRIREALRRAFGDACGRGDLGEVQSPPLATEGVEHG
jgi:hypothetical protein